MDGSSSRIVSVLTEAYGSIGDKTSVPGEPLLEEVTRIIRIYAEGLQVQPIEVISTDVSGFVLTEETARVRGASKTWRGIHRWCFELGRCTRFEAYGRTLIVTPPIADLPARGGDLRKEG